MLNVKSASFTCLSIIVAAFIAAPVRSQTYVYNTVADGNWTSNATWQNGGSGRPPTSGNCDCIININTGHRVTINQNINIANARIILMGNGSEIRFGSEILFAQTMQLTGTSSIELRDPGANIQSTSNLFGYNGNSISINGALVFEGYSTRVNSGSRGVVTGPAGVSSSMSPPAFINAMLPLKLLSFTAELNYGKVGLQWSVAEVENFDRFEIESSVNGKDWKKIADIEYSTELYTYTTNPATNGTNYYRLKMIDIGEGFTYSKIAVVNVLMVGAQVKIYPNPVSTMLYVALDKQAGAECLVELVNVGGQVMNSTRKANVETLSIDVHSLPPGKYYVRITARDGTVNACRAVVIR